MTSAACSSVGHKSQVSSVAPAATTAAPASTAARSPRELVDVVFTMSGTIEAGAEAMFCSFAQMPPDDVVAVPSAESHYTPGSHHFLVYRTGLTSVPRGSDTAHLCGSTGVTVAVAGQSNGIDSAEAFTDVTGSYYEAQVPDARRDLPRGIAHIFQPGEILLETAHYLNATASTLSSSIEFRLHTMDPNAVQQEAGTFFMVNTSIDIPPSSEATFTKTCPISQDLNLGLFWSHMHSRGYSFSAWTDDAVTERKIEGGDLYYQPGPDGWSEPHVQNYPSDPPITLHAGSNLMFSCHYRNTTAQTFVFGSSAVNNEMCILHGMYWPRADRDTEQCLSGTDSADTPVPIGN